MTISPTRARQFQVLDPCLLGRPVHLLPDFAARLGDDIGAAIAEPGARRHWGGWRLASLAFERAPDDGALRWLGVHGTYGMAAVAFERALLLGLLEGRFARNAPLSQQAAPRAQALERVTATEERLGALLARQLTGLLDARVASSLAEPAPPAAPGAASACAAPGKAEWVIRIVLRLPQPKPPSAAAAEHTDAPIPAAQEGQIWIALDHALMAQVLQGLKAGKAGAGAPRMPGQPLASTLHVRLDGRLVSKEVTLATLFGLQIGDVIPVSVGRADVLLDDARLFTAAVAEHKGKLCLTSFEDAE